MKKTALTLSCLALLAGCGKNAETVDTDQAAPASSAPAAVPKMPNGIAPQSSELGKMQLPEHALHPINDAGQGDHSQIAMVLVPAGEFIRGSNKEDKEQMKERYGFTEPLFLDEHPEHKMTLPAFYIDTYEVSNGQFKEFILKTKRKLPYEWGHNGYGLTMDEASHMKLEQLRGIAADDFQLDMDTREMSREALMAEMEKANKARDVFPVTGIDWWYADQYCKWRGERLPTEAEWEKAARGPNGLEFPWGNEFNADTTNTGDNDEWEEGYAPVGSYPQNKSPYGAYDMGGNVWEWTESWYDAYPGNDYNSQFYRQDKVIRGGGGGIGHYALSHFFRGATRQHADPRIATEDVGFRCVMDAH